MTVWIVRDRKYWNVLEICGNRSTAERYLSGNGKTESDWLIQEKKVRMETPAEIKSDAK